MTATRTPAMTDHDVPAPPADAFAARPAGWYVLAASRDVGRRPLACELLGRKLVAYRTRGGEAVVLGANCWHMGADLAGGCLAGDGDEIQCPFHGWRFGPDGRCSHVPAADEPPEDARQAAYATAERAGLVFVYPGARPGFPAPFFEGVDARTLVMAPPFAFDLNCPWWLVGTNGFDLQHFLGAHDRRLVGTPVVHSPHPAARRIVAEFEVSGPSWRDRLTRRFSGPRVTMDVTAWAGTLVFVAARFRRTTTYGMVEVRPMAPAGHDGPPRTRVTIRIFVPGRPGARGVLDPVDARVRRQFIRAFLEPDARLLEGAAYHRDRLVAADRVMIDYLRWLAPVSHGVGAKPPDSTREPT